MGERSQIFYKYLISVTVSFPLGGSFGGPESHWLSYRITLLVEMGFLVSLAVGARKGPDSVYYGIKWLQDLEEIVIDPKRCPETAREFYGYEYESDGRGGWKAIFPDRENHAIDAVRYSREDDMRNVRIR